VRPVTALVAQPYPLPWAGFSFGNRRRLEQVPR
jgi:hypothetical protein